MPREGQQILSLPRMPFRHPGAVQKAPERLAWGLVRRHAFIWGGGIVSWLTRVILQGAYPFMLPFLRDVALPHSVFFGIFVSISELLIAISLISGIGVRASSFGGLMMMLVFLFSADYPGSAPAFWNYFGASLQHCALSVCFISLIVGGKCMPWSLRLPFRKT